MMRSFITFLLAVSFLLVAVNAGITAEEFQITAEANKLEKPVSFNIKGPTHSESLPMELQDSVMVRRHLSTDVINFNTDPNYEMKVEVKAALKGQGTDTFVDSMSRGSDDLENKRLRSRS